MEKNALAKIPTGSFTGSLVGLFEKGLRYATVIDVGCADGHFFVHHCGLGLFPGATVLNIDANATYEESLKANKEVLGGHYVIAAVGERVGETMLITSEHPYWSSLRGENDPYWDRINRLHQGRITVPLVTLDSLVHDLGLKGPFLLKLDVQGGEADVLRGATEVLRDTHVIICEADLDDFEAIHGALVAAEFGLFDLTQPSWLGDRSLGWFYPVYLNRKLDHLRPRSFWDKSQNRIALDMQIKRQRDIREQLARMLAEQKQTRK